MKKQLQTTFRITLLSVIAFGTSQLFAASDSNVEAADGPGPAEMQEIMQAHITGGQLYRKKKYDEAVEHLTIAAKGGMKRSQAQLGAIHLYGLGGLPQNSKEGLGWLGVAASGVTEPAYRKEFSRVYDAVSDPQKPMVDQLVQVYVSNFGSEATKVSCDQVRRAGTRTSRLVCTFDDLPKYRDELNADTYSALSAEGQITDYAENYRSAGFGGTGGGTGGGGGGGGGGGNF